MRTLSAWLGLTLATLYFLWLSSGRMANCTMGDDDAWFLSLILGPPVALIALLLILPGRSAKTGVLWLSLLVFFPWLWAVMFVLPFFWGSTVMGRHVCMVQTGYHDLPVETWHRLWAPVQLVLMGALAWAAAGPLVRRDSLDPLRRFQPVDWAVVLVSAGLVVLSLAFLLTNGLVATEEGPRYVSQWQSTGSDDDLMILVGIPIFGLCALVIGWWPSPHRFAALCKALVFSPFWAIQAWCLQWIEIGSIPRTLMEDHNAVLGTWLLIYVSSLPAVWLAAVLSRCPDDRGPKQPQSQLEAASPVEARRCTATRRADTPDP